MKVPPILLLHLQVTIAKLLGPDGAKAVVTDSLLMKQQLLVFNRSRRPALIGVPPQLLDRSYGIQGQALYPLEPPSQEKVR